MIAPTEASGLIHCAMRIKFLSISFLCISALAFSQTDQWRVGAGGNSERYSLSQASGPDDDELLWQGGLIAAVAQQAVIEDDVVVMARMFDLADALDGTDIVAHDLATGDTLWTTQLPIDFPQTDWRSRVSALKDGVVYATRSGNTNLSYMYALDVADGSIIWQSEGLIDESSTEGCSFTSEGNIVVGNFGSVMCIDKTDGTTLWQIDRSAPTSNGQEVAVYDDKGYYWEAFFEGPKIGVVDCITGEYLYSSPGLGGGIVQQLQLFVGPDGIVYGPRTQNNDLTDFLFALEDTGDTLQVMWQTPLAYVPFSTFGVGNDGSVYSYSKTGRVLRLDPLSGEPVDSSQVILTDGSTHSPRMAIDANGYVNVTNGEFISGMFYSFNPDLSLRWESVIQNVNIGGPAIAEDGTMVICGVGDNVRAYAGTTPITHIKPYILGDFRAWPNPATDKLTLDLSKFAEYDDLTLAVRELKGEIVDQISLMGMSLQEPIELDVSKYAVGHYLLALHRNATVVGSSRVTVISSK